MLKKVSEYVQKWRMLEKEDRIIAGVSGGADSICLLFVLLELQRSIPFELVVVHVNHGLRGEEADRDEAYVKALCKEHGLICETYFENIELIAKKRKQSTEEAGREIRREAFLDAMKRYGGTKIALAHHMNDNAETLLLNLSRGTGLKGMCGILPVAGDIIRPLLCLKRDEIEQYLKTNQISYCVDKTNASDDYTRNRIRNHVIPYLEQEVNAATVSHMSDEMEQLREIWEYLQGQVESAFEACVCRQGESYIVSEEAFLKVPGALRPLVLKEVLRRISGMEKDIQSAHLKSLHELMGKQVGRRLDLPYGMEARRTYQGILACKKKPASTNELCAKLCFENASVQEVELQNGRILCRLLENVKEAQRCLQKSGTKCFDYDIIKGNVCIRTRRPGDYITIHPDGRSQKLKSFFINEKIPQEERDKILLVADGNHILWIVGFRTNPVYQVSENTKRVLEIQMK